MRRDIKELVSEVEAGEDFIVDESHANILTLKDAFNGLDRHGDKVSKWELLDGLALAEKLLNGTARAIALVDYASGTRKVVGVGDVARAIGRLDAETLEWLDVVTSFIESSKKREMMKGFLAGGALEPNVNQRGKHYDYHLSDLYQGGELPHGTRNAPPPSAPFEKPYTHHDISNYAFKLADADIDFSTELKPAPVRTVN